MDADRVEVLQATVFPFLENLHPLRFCSDALSGIKNSEDSLLVNLEDVKSRLWVLL